MPVPANPAGQDPLLTAAAQILLPPADMGACRTDAALAIRHGAGAMMPPFTPGEPVTAVLPVLAGLEDDLAAIAAGTAEALHLPTVALLDGDGAPAYRTLDIRRDGDGLLIILRDAGDLAAIQGALIQKHNDLALAQRELERARLAAEAANRAKSAFLANISHDLRTPLSIIIGNGELLRDDAHRLDGAARKLMAGDILDSGRLLLTLVNDLLDLARAEAGRLDLREEDTAIADLLEEAASLAAAMPGAADLTITVAPCDPALAVWCDPVRIKQALLNLLSNAVKFSRPGGSVRAAAGAEADGTVVLTVHDDGIGMDAARASLAGSEAFTASSTGRHGETGSGLGLSIVRVIAGLHGGSFTLDSTPGKGTLARITLPPARVISPVPGGAAP